MAVCVVAEPIYPTIQLPLRAQLCLLAQAARDHTRASVLRARSAGEHSRNQLRRSRRIGVRSRLIEARARDTVREVRS